MEKPTVSIITPAYNCVKTITETYESIKKQSFKSWEWIVVEDCSSDNSFQVINELAKHNPKVVVLRTEKNSGAAIARNLGIEKAKGKYIAFLDSDDLWKENKLEKQIEFMQSNNFAFTFTDYDLLFDDGRVKSHTTKKNTIDYKSLLRRNDIGCLTVIYDKDLVGKVFMPTDCEKREDHGAWLDITRNGCLAHRLSESLSVYRIGSSTVSSNKYKMMKYQYRVYRNHEKFGPLKSAWYLLICTLNKIFRKY